MDRVFDIAYPPTYYKIMKSLGYVFHVLFKWLPGFSASCAGLQLDSELLLVCLIPVGINGAAVIINRLLNKPLQTVIPFSLVFSFVVFPFASSQGFRALAKCDCFTYESWPACSD